ncbi:MAG: hypothetical protein ACUVTM_06315 [Candidatus Bathyarchaeia archaeon]
MEVNMGMILERGKTSTKWKIYKFKDGDGRIEKLGREGVAVQEILTQYSDDLMEKLEVDGNILLNEGINELWTLACGSGGTKWDSSNAYIGVGDGSVSESASQIGLQGTNKLYKGMDSGYPLYGSNQKAVWRATFGNDDANWTWNEVTVSNSDSDAGKNLNRKVQNLGTKTSGSTWIITLEITLS